MIRTNPPTAKLDVQAVQALVQSAIQLMLRGEWAAAESNYLRVLEAFPRHPDALHLLGVLRGKQERNHEAVQLIERALAVRPDVAAFHHNLGGIFRKLGHFGDAERELRRAIQLKPDYGEAYHALAEMTRFKADDPLLAQILARLADPALDARARSFLEFSAGKALDELGDYDRAFAHYVRGNKAANRTFNNDAFKRQVKDSLYVYSRRLVASLEGAGHASRQPVFIVGMPRSGTTLVEQILSSHPRVYGAGELPDMEFVIKRSASMVDTKQAYPNWFPSLPRHGYRELGETYLGRIAGRLPAGGCDRFIDKNPMNFQAVGPILTIFPHAKVIHLVRDPLDTCLSCYFQYFTNGQDFTFDLHALAAFYVDYRRLMEHWQQLFGDRMLEVSYEALLDNQRAETERLLAYCDLEFDAACMNFQASTRAVSTASFMQVRQPLYTSSRHRWMHYAQHLSGLAAELGISIEGQGPEPRRHAA